MRRLALFVFFSVIYIGCASRGPGASDPATPGGPALRPGGSLRLWLPAVTPEDGWPLDRCADASGLLSGSLGRGLVRLDGDGRARPAIATTWQRERAGESGERWVFELDPAASFPDGAPVTAAAVADWWTRELRDPCSAARWLLGAVDGIETGEPGRLVLRLGREVADLPVRLAHPALHVYAPRASRFAAGPAAFAPAAEPGAFDRREPVGRARGLDRLELVGRPDDDPSLLLRVGEADAAVVSGRGAAELRDADLDLVALDGWERTYALWAGAETWPLRDRRFRLALASAIDSAALLDRIFAGAGAVPESLLPGASPASAEPAPPLATFRGERVELLFDRDDAAAAAIAARVRAEAIEHGVRCELRPAAAAEYRRLLAEGPASLALVVHRRILGDPLLDLGDTLWRLGAGAREALELLDRASRFEEPEPRRTEARFVEDLLLREARIVPLVRLRAWLATSGDLVGIEAGLWGRLDLERAGWRR
jgi:MarR-like DNA-binding transcriptional regulator SgrR of sgrS sRNA